MNETVTKSLDKVAGKAHYERACQVIPGGMMSNFRRDEGYVPTYYAGGDGAWLTDIDGNQYLDYSLGYGPSVLGHNPPAVTRALIDQLKRFSSCESTVVQTEAAERLAAHVPCAELVRFACSGTEAVYNVCRIARAHTGRGKIVRFNGHYDGGLDELLGGVVADQAYPVPHQGEREDDFFSQLANTQGRAPHALSDVFLIEWNDLDALETLFSAHGDEIAGVLMEPVMVNVSGCLPMPGYLEGVRELCNRYGAVLIFDEVITGFRMGLGGAQGHFGVTPDLATFGKALGAGFPVAAFCGRREVMDVVTRTEVIAGGTYNGHPLAMAAVCATIDELAKDDGAAMAHLQAMGTLLGEGLNRLFAQYEPHLRVQGFPGAWTLAYEPEGKAIVRHAQALGVDSHLPIGAFVGGMQGRGIVMQTRMCTSVAHNAEDVAHALAMAEDTLREMTGA